MPTLPPRAPFAALTAVLAAAAAAQSEPEQSTRHWLGIDSGYVANTSSSPAARGIPQVVWSTVVSVPGAAWLRLEYAGVLLAGARDRGGDGSFVRVVSLRDGHAQTQHLLHVGQWRDSSAYFNGDAVLVELLAHPGTGENRLVLGHASAGPVLPAMPDTICGPTDDRVLSNDPRVARNQPTGCTSWLIDDCKHCFLTAGHCASGVNVVQFNVPLSTSSGALQHPGPQDQYAVDPASMQTNGGQGVGNDWAYFGVFPNSTTGLLPHQANGGQAFDLATTPPAVAGQSIRITGCGSTSAPVSPTWYLVPKTHAGPYSTFTGTTVQYATDTTGGNSGSPVILDGTNTAIGIHTHGGCSSGGGANSGTGSNHAALQAALAAPQGVCDCPGIVFSYPNGLPQFVLPNGTTTVRVQTAGPVAAVPGSVRMHVSTGGAFAPVVPAQINPTTFDATVPASPCGTTVRFYFSAQDAGGTTFTDPRTAPAAAHAATSAQSLATLRSYDFNTAPPGWTVVNDASLTTGAWQRATPLAGVSGAPAADFDGSGQCWVTDNRSGNFDVDGGPTRLVTETFDLSAANDPTVRYALWFTNDDGDDRLVVELSPNGGGSWIPVASLAPFQSWQAQSLRVRAFTGTLAQIALRFSVADNPNNSVTEAGLDAFAIEDIVCSQPMWTAYGTGCAGSSGVPTLQNTTLPALGGTFSLALQNVGAGAPFMVTGLAAQSVPLQPFGFGAGCTLLATVDDVRLLAAVGGTATWSIALPSLPALAGLHLFNQGVVFGAQPAVSNGGDATLQ